MKFKTLILTALKFATFSSVVCTAQAVTITIDGSSVPTATGSGDPSIPGAAPLLYGASKSGGVITEVGDAGFIGSYASAWTASDKVETTTNTPPPTINSNPVYVAVWNAANYTGNFELFTVANWDGSGLIIDKPLGASVDIPSYKIFGNQSIAQTSAVPDGCSTLLLLGSVVTGLGIIRRRPARHSRLRAKPL